MHAEIMDRTSSRTSSVPPPASPAARSENRGAMEWANIGTQLIERTHHFHMFAPSALLGETGQAYVFELSAFMRDAGYFHALDAATKPSYHAEIPTAIPAPSAAPALSDANDTLKKARADRLALLVREFEGSNFSREDEARIGILTERLRRLSPKITGPHWAVAEKSVAALEGTTQRVADLRHKYGL